MVEIILQNCGAVATLAAIIVEEDDPIPGWSIVSLDFTLPTLTFLVEYRDIHVFISLPN